MRSVRNLCVLVVLAGLIATAAACGGSSGGSSGGVTNIVLWHGYVDTEGKAIKAMVAQFNASHPKIHVTAQFYGNSDYALQKVTTAIAGGKPPDIAYLYGSWAANIAQSPKTLALNDYIKADKSFNWNDFWPSERQVATVNGKIVGIPALVDNLALVYNKKLFQQAGIPFPTASWTWQDLRSAAQKLTDAGKKQFGWAYVNDASEDTVWRFEALLWQAGGEILSSDGKHAAFDSPAGVQALTLLQQMAVQDHSVYLDSGNDLYATLFNSGNIGMLYTGPWDLSQFPKVNYGVQILPGDLNHQTISRPGQLGAVQQRLRPRQGGVHVHELVHEPTAGPRVGDEDGRPADPPVGAEAARLRAVHRQVPGRRHVRPEPEQRDPGAAGDAALPEDLGGDRPGGAGGAAREGAAAAGARPGRRPR